MTRNFPQTMLRLEQIETDPANVFRHDDGDIQRLVGVVQEYGFLAPVTVDADSAHTVDGVERYRLVGGEARLESARLAGLTEIPATLATFESEQHRTAAAVALNGHFGHFDDDALRTTLETLNATGFDLDMTGLKPHELDDLLSSLNGNGLTDPDDVPEPPAEPVTQRGDLILLGRHRVICGDSTDAADVEALMNGQRADMLWTDPPYGVEYVGKTKDALTLVNDSEHGLYSLLCAVFGNTTTALLPGAAFYVAHPPGVLHRIFWNAVFEVGWQIHQELIWLKDSMVLGHADYHFKHEPILYGWVPGPGRSGRGNHQGSKWNGDHAQTSVFDIPRPKRSTEHPTMKPTELVEACLLNSSPARGSVLDVFAGSGSTLIAAEQSGRTAYLCEIDPKYCDVIISRYEAFTGTSAIRPERVAA